MDARATWYFDFVSPFAYLQWRRLQQLGIEGLTYRPILFAGILNELGHKGPAEIPSKRTFTYRYVTWRARHDGIAMTFPRAHPFNPLPALRLCIAAGTTVQAIDTAFRHIWEQGNSIETPSEIEALAQRLGLAEAAAALSNEDTKRTLRENFAHAQEARIFGVPTLVCEGHLFWGDDATEMFLDYLRDPVAFNSVEMDRVTHLPIGRARPKAAV